jgi:hypothetical protein
VFCGYCNYRGFLGIKVPICTRREKDGINQGGKAPSPGRRASPTFEAFPQRRYSALEGARPFTVRTRLIYEWWAEPLTPLRCVRLPSGKA